MSSAHAHIVTMLKKIGIDALGIVRAQDLMSSPKFYDKAVLGRMPLGLEYLERHAPLKRHLEPVLEGARSVIVCAFVLPAIVRDDGLKWARFCALDDYHQVVRQRLEKLVQRLVNDYGIFKYRICVDSAPLLERAWAVLAGLGVIGQNRLLIHPELGSHLVLGEVICDKDFSTEAERLRYRSKAKATDTEATHRSELTPGAMCSAPQSCNACIKACPTGALTRDGYDVTRCLGYWSTQDRQAIPEDFAQAMGRTLWGCDICQNVCPHNTKQAEPQNAVDKVLQSLSLGDILKSSGKQLQKKLANTPLNHARSYAIQRNACLVVANMGIKDYLPQLKELAQNTPCDWLRKTAEQSIKKLGDKND